MANVSAMIDEIRSNIRYSNRRIKEAMKETNHDSVIRLKVYMERLEVYRDCLATVKKYAV